jgi:hypothetical protein
MKNRNYSIIFFVTLATLLFSSCMTRYPGSVATDPYRVKDFPTPRHKSNIKIFYLGDRLPAERSYIQTHLFEALDFPGTPLNRQVRQLVDKAGFAGVDAIIIESHGDIWRTLPNGLRVRENVARAKGIKFKQRVNYLHLYRYADQLFKYEAPKDSFELIANLFPDFNGKIVKVEGDNQAKANHYYRNYIRLYSLDFLLGDESDNWRYKKTLSGKVTKREHFDRGKKTIKLKLKYEPGTKKISYIDGQFLGEAGRWDKKEIWLKFGDNKLIEEKLILREGVPFLVERFLYDDQNKLITSTYYKFVDGGEQPFLQTQYYYYEKEDLDKLF